MGNAMGLIPLPWGWIGRAGLEGLEMAILGPVLAPETPKNGLNPFVFMGLGPEISPCL